LEEKYTFRLKSKNVIFQQNQKMFPQSKSQKSVSLSGEGEGESQEE